MNREDFARFFSDRYHFIKHAEHVYEVVPHGCDKADGMRMMTEYLGIPTENVVAFGDGLNDMDMLKSSGTGVAMGNARQELKDLKNLKRRISRFAILIRTVITASLNSLITSRMKAGDAQFFHVLTRT